MSSQRPETSAVKRLTDGNRYLCSDLIDSILKQVQFRVLLRKEYESTHTAIVPSIPGCVTWDETIEEANTKAREAAGDCLEIYAEKGIVVHQVS